MLNNFLLGCLAVERQAQPAVVALEVVKYQLYLVLGIGTMGRLQDALVGLRECGGNN